MLSAIKLDFVANSIKDSTGWFGQLFIGGKNKNDKDEKEKEEALLNKERIDKLASLFERTITERQVLQVQSIEQFLSEFRKLIDQFTKNEKKVFVFIDDLDRCLPESALEIFESIKLFLDAPGCGYIVALDREVIRKGLAIKYAQKGGVAVNNIFINPDEYIEKTISVSFDLPRLSEEDAYELINDFKLPIILDKQHMKLIIAGLGTNPRRVKRFMNTLAVYLRLDEIVMEASPSGHNKIILNSDRQTIELFLKLLLISYRYPGIFASALDDSLLFGRLTVIAKKYIGNDDQEKARKERRDALLVETPIISTLQDEEEFWKFLCAEPSLQNQSNLTQLLNWFRYREKK